jgi:hypothetical protein
MNTERISIDEWFYNKKLIELNHDEKTIRWLSPTRRDSIPSDERSRLLKWRYKGFTVLNESAISNHNNNDQWNRHSTFPF